MDENLQLTKLLEWLSESGRTKAWFARKVGYSYQQAWAKLAGKSPLNDSFVVACFSKIPELPPDIFKGQGYMRDDGCVFKRIVLNIELEEIQL